MTGYGIKSAASHIFFHHATHITTLVKPPRLVQVVTGWWRTRSLRARENHSIAHERGNGMNRQAITPPYSRGYRRVEEGRSVIGYVGARENTAVGVWCRRRRGAGMPAESTVRVVVVKSPVVRSKTMLVAHAGRGKRSRCAAGGSI